MERRLAAVTDGGMERCDQQGPRAAGKRSEELVMRQKKGSAGDPWSHVASLGSSGLTRSRISSCPSGPSLVSLMQQEEAHIFD